MDTVAFGDSAFQGQVKESTPQSLEQLVGVGTNVTTLKVRTNRWLIGADLLNFNPNTYTAYTVYAGVSLGNRLDVMYGVGYSGEIRQHVLLVARF